jgi:hypothetical protein
MSAQIQTLPDGSEALVITTGTAIEVIGLDVIASYSELLGEPDSVKTVALIRGAMKIKDQTGMWQPLYSGLSEGLRELVDAGVPPEFMPDMLEEATGSPVPGPGGAGRMRAAQAAARDRLGAQGGQVSGQETAQLRALLVGQRDRIKSGRAAFLKEVAPPRREPTKTAPPLFGRR